jgi:Zn-dependent protease with chaperone function
VLKGLVLACAGFALFLVIHIPLFRLRVSEFRFRTMVRIAFALGILLLVAYLATPSDLGFLPAASTTAGWAVDLLNGLLVFAFLFVGYCMFYFLIDRGFSGRIMIEVEASPHRRLPPAEIAARYSLEMVLRRRLGEMLEIGRITVRDGRYCNTKKGRWSVAMFAFVKKFLQLGEGG